MFLLVLDFLRKGPIRDLPYRHVSSYVGFLHKGPIRDLPYKHVSSYVGFFRVMGL